MIDNGHGVETPGKRSPDGRLLEWEWTRRVARRVAEGLRAKGLDAGLLVPEDRDVPLRERTARANAMEGACMLISIHANAAGRGEWRQARGWSAFVAPNASADSKRMASLLAKEAERLGLTVRRPMPGQDFWVQNLAICRDTRCPAALITASCNSSGNSVGNATSTSRANCALDFFSALVTDSQSVCLSAYSFGACPGNKISRCMTPPFRVKSWVIPVSLSQSLSPARYAAAAMTDFPLLRPIILTEQ